MRVIGLAIAIGCALVDPNGSHVWGSVVIHAKSRAAALVGA